MVTADMANKAKDADAFSTLMKAYAETKDPVSSSGGGGSSSSSSSNRSSSEWEYRPPHFFKWHCIWFYWRLD